MSRIAVIERKTTETDIVLELELDGNGSCSIQTPVPFFNHMLEQVARHGFFDIKLRAQGDVEIDDHHTVEDVGIVLGLAFREALGNKSGIRRYGAKTIPMDEALASVAVDFCGRPCLVFDVDLPKSKVGNFDTELVKEFFTAFVNQAAATLHIHLLCGDNIHHVIEAIFKAFARTLDEAVGIDPRISGVLSTKGKL
ncbi:MAG: imidazoleglycerol-phosphate dehydratase HisB [Desulfuromonadaceae bacterium]|nr:imidazoleglycerol-phosphate dehydratase HisB [Desulfuromonadaceae bacterium]